MDHIITHLINHGIKDPHQIQLVAVLMMDATYDSYVRSAAEELVAMPFEKVENTIQQVIGGR
jgi:hypothetical protein